MIILPENQNDNSLLSSKGHSKSSKIVTLDKGNPRKNLVTLTSSPLKKNPINIIERTEPDGSKPHYKGYDNYYTRISNGKDDDSTWEGRTTATPLAPPDDWGAQVVQNEFSGKGRQATVPGGGMPGGVSDTSGDAGALRAPARPRHRGYTGGGQPPPTTVPPVRPSGLQEGA